MTNVVKPKELREIFLAYHTMDPRQYKIIRKIRADK